MMEEARRQIGSVHFVTECETQQLNRVMALPQESTASPVVGKEHCQINSLHIKAEKDESEDNMETQPSAIVPEFNEETCSVLEKRWLSMSKKEKQICSDAITKWLEDHYVEADKISLHRPLVYQHYTHYCVQCSVKTQNHGIFDKILFKKYPNVTLKRTIRGEVGLYYQNLDIKKDSDEYETVCKGRRTFKIESHLPSKKGKKRKVDDENTSDGDGGGANGCVQVAADPLRLEDDPTCSKALPSWLSMSADEKKSHKLETIEWLKNEYEISPAICIPRTALYKHYLQFCHLNNSPPAPQNRFGECVCKAFKKLKRRRLGTRGNSQYCYMGLDIREESTDYERMMAERIICPPGNPKVNRIQTVDRARVSTSRFSVTRHKPASHSSRDLHVTSP